MSDPPKRHGEPDNERLGIFVIVGMVLLLALIAFAFVYVGNVAGVLVIFATGAVAYYFMFAWDRRGPIEVAASPGDGVHRTLVFVDADVDPRRLARKLELIDGDPGSELRVVVPPRTDILHRAASDYDDARERAQSQLDGIRHALSEHFGEVDGYVGDPEEQLALEDALRIYPADELVVVNAPAERRQEMQAIVAERAERDVPVRVLELTGE